MPVIQIMSMDARVKYSKQQMMERMEHRINDKLAWSRDRIAIYFQKIEAHEYLLKGKLSDHVTENEFHPIVYIHYSDNKTEEDMRLICEIISEEISKSMQIDVENVCIIRVPLKPGHLYNKSRYI